MLGGGGHGKKRAEGWSSLALNRVFRAVHPELTWEQRLEKVSELVHTAEADGGKSLPSQAREVPFHRIPTLSAKGDTETELVPGAEWGLSIR